MQRIVIGILFFMALAGNTFAGPSPVAKFIFEDAEAAYAKQDYQTTLTKLDEAEKEFGKLNPPILYLRIMARHGLLQGNPSDFDTGVRLRAETARYLKDYGELESVQDKAREVYRVLNELKQYPATREEHQAKLDADAAREAAAEKARADEVARRRQAGYVFRDCPDCPEMVVIAGGSFDMGTAGFLVPSHEKPRHRVTISAPFAISRTEVTQGQWKTVMGSNPSHFSNCGDNCPVENVSWNDAQEYIRKLNANTGGQYRLPTEAEWEYACQAGVEQEYCGSDAVWYAGNSEDTTHPVAHSQSNAWGLYDMSGNVGEWVEDCFHDSYEGAPSNGSAWTSGGCEWRVIRGGSWGNWMHEMRATRRVDREANLHSEYLGFRLVKSLP